MAIVPLVKVTLYGPLAEKDAVLDGLQALGCLHLDDLARAGSEGAQEPLNRNQGARDALRYLRDSPVRRHPLDAAEKVDLEAVVRETLDVRERSRALGEERVQLEKWIADLAPWGDFELPDWAREGRMRFWFYSVPLYQLERLVEVDSPWQIVSRDHRFAYVVAVAPEQPGRMPGTPLPIEPRSLSKLRSRLHDVEREIEELDYRRIGLTLYTDVLGASLDEADDLAARRKASERVLAADHVFAVRGWAPEARAEDVRRFAAERALAVTIEPPAPGDDPPTLLDNPEALRGGEDLVSFYMTPAYRLWDPSKAVLIAFAVFFAMIMADAGYALVLGGILWFYWRRLGASASGRGLRGTTLLVAAFSIVYGVLVGSYFGVSPKEGSPLAMLKLIDANDQALMMWISIGVGVAHLTIANLVSAWGRRRSPAALGPLGWAAAILGVFAIGLANAYAPLAGLKRAGVAGFAAGAALVLLFSSERPLSFAPRHLFGRLADGLKAATQVSKAFGDVLSYLRLFALGLAALKLAEVFNQLAAASFGIKGVGVLLGVLILLAGHTLNFVMGIMSGVVHSLRLNLIEFFSWSVPDEGRRFDAFAKRVRQ
ncbi:MAG TPA: V-type ATP synthase subunit I [Gammaproteobacteria bacterium]|nr:V-type ATP synthase subunit I [Gammaproteobacteria bacterium]